MIGHAECRMVCVRGEHWRVIQALALVLSRSRNSVRAEKIVNPGDHNAKGCRRYLVGAATKEKQRTAASMMEHSLVVEPCRVPVSVAVGHRLH